MIVVGVILLLPGVCAGYFATAALFSPSDAYLTTLMPLWLICFAVAAGGIAMLIRGFKRLKP